MNEAKDFIESTFGIKLLSIKPCRAGYILETEAGKKHLRPYQCSESRILYVHEVKDYLFHHGFTNLDTYTITLDGKPYMALDGKFYVMTPYIDARECEFSDDNDTIKSSTALANMHLTGRGFKPSKDIFVPSELGKLPESLKKRYDEILRMRRKAERERGAFDYRYIDCVDKFIKISEKSLDLLSDVQYPRLVKKALVEGCVCHHDYSYQNILIKDSITYIIGFEACCEELRIYDLVNLIRRKMRKCDWDPKKASMLLAAYMKVYPLSSDEIYVMRAMLLFPQKFWRVANRYYNSRRSWAQKNFINMLEEVIDEYRVHISFMNQYDKLFL